MRITGLAIQEAVKLLKKGDCTGIRNDRTGVYYSLGKHWELSLDDLFDTYTLINPEIKLSESRKQVFYEAAMYLLDIARNKQEAINASTPKGRIPDRTEAVIYRAAASDLILKAEEEAN